MKSIVCIAAIILLLGITTLVYAGSPAPPIRLWDTITPLSDPNNISQRKGWRAVDAKTARQGDLAVETGPVIVVFNSKKGRVQLYSKDVLTAIMIPADLLEKAITLGPILITSGEENPLTIHTSFSPAGAKERPVMFSFAEPGIVGIWPKDDARSIAVVAPLQLAIVPSFVGDDLIYDRRAYPIGTSSLYLMSEHILLGLLQHGDDELVMTWQQDIPMIRWRGGTSQGGRPRKAADVLVGR